MKSTLRVVRSRERREREGSDGEVKSEGEGEEGRKEGWMEKVTVSVSVERVWRDIPLSHPLLVGGVVSTFPSLPPLPPDL